MDGAEPPRQVINRHAVVLFASVATAERRIAGVPAVARVAHQLEIAAQEVGADLSCAFVVADGWRPTGAVASELRRLAPRLALRLTDTVSERAATLVLHGEHLPMAADLASRLIDDPLEADAKPLGAAVAIAALRRRERGILRATAKSQDGIVSRLLNRPVSRLISGGLLHIPAVRPWHATIGTALIGLAMAVALFFGGDRGLIAGALLFQAASMFDGVDGEIARATFRTSREGASADSLVDAATNFAFIGGVSFNLWQRGDGTAAALGLSGLLLLAAGNFLLGRRARVADQAVHFDALKHHFAADGSPVMQMMIWITMRDFYAAVGALAIVLGFASEAMLVFCLATAAWFAVTALTFARTRQVKP